MKPTHICLCGIPFEHTASEHVAELQRKMKERKVHNENEKRLVWNDNPPATPRLEKITHF